jgi:hypothetical protein
VNSYPAPPLVAYPVQARDIAAELDRLMQREGWGSPDNDDLRSALVQIGARYGESLLRCVNAAADLHLQAFAGLIGGRPRPAQAAYAFLTFKPAAGRSAEPVVVPRHTRVAAPPPPGESEMVVFETQADLALVRAQPVRAVLVDAGHRHVVDADALVVEQKPRTESAASATPVLQAFHIGDATTFGVKGLRQVKLYAEVLDPGVRDPSSVLEWCVSGAEGDQVLAIESDSTAGLSRSGEVVLVAPAAWGPSVVGGVTARWLSLRLRAAQGAAVAASADTPPLSRPPRLASIQVQATAATDVEPVAAACHDGAPLDISKDMFPFGEHPRFGSCLLVQSAAFGQAGSRVELLIRLTNAEGSLSSPIPAVSSEGRPSVVWEISTPTGFKPISVNDGTRSLTRDGSVMFTVPDGVASTPIAGKDGPWLRARLAGGHYGSAPAAPGATISVPRAPSIRKMAVRSTLETGRVVPDHLIAQGALSLHHIDPDAAAIDVFVPADTPEPALYIALDTANGTLKRGQVLSWHVRPAQAAPPLAVSERSSAAPALRWQMRGPDGWCDLAVQDDSAGFSRSGIVWLTLPGSAAPWLGCTLDPAGRWAWLRVLLPHTTPPMPQPIGLALNSVEATHSQLIRNEIVGSGSGRAAQVFKSLRTPIVGEVQLQVREPSDEWITWQEVADLDGARPGDRVFTLDRLSGEICFGDARCGRIPPAGASNIRLRRYTIGGGLRGNRPAGSISQLLGAVPAVESVINLDAAGGGLDAETEPRMHAQASAWLRHRDRAVGPDDFADLALKTSPEVARAYGVPGRDLAAAMRAAADGTVIDEAGMQAGAVSVIVVPHGDEARPQPSLDLLAVVKTELDARRSPLGRLVVVGPCYAQAAVRVVVLAHKDYSPHELAAECARCIERFLHPLHGGAAGNGWRLGQKPHRSDLYGLLGAVDGVQELRSLSLRIDAPAGLPFIVSAGAIDVAAAE